MRTGCPWADRPERFGKLNTVRKRFRHRAKKGVGTAGSTPYKLPGWDWVLPDPTVWCGRTSIRWAKKSAPETECPGRSCGGMGTKSHACIELLGTAVRLMATVGQAGDSPLALPLLADLAPGQVLADTAYASDATRAYCAKKGIEARPMDEETDHDRNKVERFLGRLKHYRRLATRSEKNRRLIPRLLAHCRSAGLD